MVPAQHPLAKPNTTYLPVVPVPGAPVPSVGVKPGPWDKGLSTYTCLACLVSPAASRQSSCGPCPALTGQTKHHLPSCGPCPLAKPNTTYLPVVPVPGAPVPSVGAKPGPWDKGLPNTTHREQTLTRSRWSKWQQTQQTNKTHNTDSDNISPTSSGPKGPFKSDLRRELPSRSLTHSREGHCVRRSARLIARARALASEIGGTEQDQTLRDTSTGQKTGQGPMSGTRTVGKF